MSKVKKNIHSDPNISLNNELDNNYHPSSDLKHDFSIQNQFPKNDLLLAPVINLLELYHKDPDFTIFFLKNNHLFYDDIEKKIIKNVPFESSFPNANQLNNLINITGTIIKVSPTLLTNIKKQIKCASCDLVQEKSSFCVSCKKKDFITQENYQDAIPCQIIRIQDIKNLRSCNTIKIEIKNSNIVLLPGDTISVLGIVSVNIIPKPEIFVRAHTISRKRRIKKHLDISFIREMTYFEKQVFLIENFSKEIIGNENVKLGLLLATMYKTVEQPEFSYNKSDTDQKDSNKENSSKNDSRIDNKLDDSNKESETDHSNIRLNTHILLVGSTGTGKSHLLRSFPSTVKKTEINGYNTSEAGLTTCAVRCDNEWVLENGALIQSDNGLCIIDSFNYLSKIDCQGLLEVMEQQTLSTTKASIMCSLKARCSIIGAFTINYDEEKSIDENLKIGTPLISRFDLIFNMKYEQKNVAEKILSRSDPVKEDDWLNEYISQIGFKNEHERDLIWNEMEKNNDIDSKKNLENKKTQVQEPNESVILDDNCKNWTHAYFKYKKRKKGLFTLRNLESIIRLSACHSKLLMKNKIDEQTIFTIFFLIESTVYSNECVDNRIFIDEKYFKKKVFEFKKELLKNKK